MKMMRERRRGNFFMAFAMVVIFILSFIYVLMYYDLQTKYLDLLKKQAVTDYLRRAP